MSIKRIIERSDSFSGNLFDVLVQLCIVISLISFSVETLPDLSEPFRRFLYFVEVATVAIFTLEYALRVVVADNRLRFIFSFYGLIDLLAILPFYMAIGIDLRAIRTIRFLRLFRLFKFSRYTEAMRRFRDAFIDIKEELVIYLAATGILVFLSSVGIYYFERDAQPEKFASVFHCLWWSIITLTTVGYGDTFPVTIGGRVFTAIILLLGVAVIAIPSGLLAASLAKTKAKE